MKRSTDRILTTHAGSLPRPDDVLALLRADARDEAFEERMRSAVDEVVRQQVEHGLDIVDDGEMSKPSFVTYATQRLGGFEAREGASTVASFAGSREHLSFSEFYAAADGPSPGGVGRDRPIQWVCTEPIRYTGEMAVKRDILNLKMALLRTDATEAFLPAISPSNVLSLFVNDYYSTDEEFELAIA